MEKRNVFDVLKERGYIEQCTHEEEIRESSTSLILSSIYD
jgi:ribosomal protein S8